MLYFPWFWVNPLACHPSSSPPPVPMLHRVHSSAIIVSALREVALLSLLEHAASTLDLGLFAFLVYWGVCLHSSAEVKNSLNSSCCWVVVVSWLSIRHGCSNYNRKCQVLCSVHIIMYFYLISWRWAIFGKYPMLCVDTGFSCVYLEWRFQVKTRSAGESSRKLIKENKSNDLSFVVPFLPRLWFEEFCIQTSPSPAMNSQHLLQWYHFVSFSVRLLLPGCAVLVCQFCKVNKSLLAP